LLCAVGGRGLLVGRSHECDFPAGLEDVPVLTGQKIHETHPATIDALVREELARNDGQGAQSLYTLDAAKLASLKPDIILTQDLCEVCSIDLGTVQRVAQSLSPPPAIVSLNPHTVEDILDDLLRVGDAAGLTHHARTKVVQLRERLFAAAEYVNPFDDGPTVAFLEWTDPIFVGGHWTAQLIERAGARHELNPTRTMPDAGDAAGSQQSQRRAGKSIRVSDADFVASQPEYIIVCPCGFDLGAALKATEALAQRPWWSQLPAVRNGRVAVVDGGQMFNRPGPRVVDAFEWLVGWINGRESMTPQDFPWQRWRG